VKRFLARQRHAFGRETESSPLRWNFSPATYLELRDTIPVLRARVRGAVLDVGCGTIPFLPYCRELVERWDGLDFERRSPQTRFLCSAEEMTPVADESYDAVVCLSALEHMRHPWLALGEMARVARPGAPIVILVPHLTRLHEEPHDYFRFTPYALASLAEDTGLEVVEVRGVVGPLCFLGHQLSSLLVPLSWGVPLLRWIVFWLNYAFVVRPAPLLDRVLGLERVAPLDVLAVLRRPSGEGAGAAPVARPE
jgi:SAM-dependent methyltransferase